MSDKDKCQEGEWGDIELDRSRFWKLSEPSPPAYFMWDGTDLWKMAGND